VRYICSRPPAGAGNRGRGAPGRGMVYGGMTRQYHVQLSAGDIASCVLLPGDPGRVPVVASQWDDAREVAHNREFVTYTGTYKGVPISCTSTGIGAPSTAIALEELARVGATTFVRIGTCGTFRDDVAVGDIAILDSAARYDGASRQYAPIEYPAAASHDVVAAAIEAASQLDVPAHVGTTYSADAFSVPRGGSAFGGYWQSGWSETYEDLKRMNVLAAEMEAGVIMVLARIWGLRAGAIAVVVDNVFADGEAGAFDPESTFSAGVERIEPLARMGCEIVRILHERGLAGEA
jgi:uridine phosphorylase